MSLYLPSLHCPKAGRMLTPWEMKCPCTEWWCWLCKKVFFFSWWCWKWYLGKARHSMCRISRSCEIKINIKRFLSIINYCSLLCRVRCALSSASVKNHGRNRDSSILKFWVTNKYKTWPLSNFIRINDSAPLPEFLFLLLLTILLIIISEMTFE